jgi:hypothetical protein
MHSKKMSEDDSQGNTSSLPKLLFYYNMKIKTPLEMGIS